MNLVRLSVLAALVLLNGCTFLMHPISSTFARHSNPISGWKLSWSQDPEKRDKAIRDDYQDYINNLPQRERGGIVSFYEDGTGQRAVEIEIGLKGTSWKHVLIYDNHNKRVKVVKYVSGYYMS